jgi:hypothetical protein
MSPGRTKKILTARMKLPTTPCASGDAVCRLSLVVPHPGLTTSGYHLQMAARFMS